MSQHLVVEVLLHGDRFHGRGEWPPSPARLFQALVAGAAHPDLSSRDREALEWLQSLNAPVVACPDSIPGQRFVSYVPNNDLDAVGGDPHRTEEIRTTKVMEPRLLASRAAFTYVWSLDGEDECHLPAIREMVDRIYQFGRGTDMAWGHSQIVEGDALDAWLAGYPGHIHTPVPCPGGSRLRVPTQGTLDSLVVRHAAQNRRFQIQGQGRQRKQIFCQPPKPHFAEASYDCEPSELLYELRSVADLASFVPWPQRRSVQLVERLRNAVVDRLIKALPNRRPDVEHVLVGRRADGTNGYPSALRVQIVPLPSIGHKYAGYGIRRVLIVVPAGGLLAPGDLHWAFSGLETDGPGAGSPAIILVPAQPGGSMPRWFGLANARGKLWRSATPVAVPDSAARRRIEPQNQVAEAKAGGERVAEEERACLAVAQALRHAGMREAVGSIRVQREPFAGRGERAEAFAEGSRFAKERLWHVEIEFTRARCGPLVLGDGRFLGLGVMSLATARSSVIAFAIREGLAEADPLVLTHALRRAVMARVQQQMGPRAALPGFITGHDDDGNPLRGHRHLAFSADVSRRLLLVFLPNAFTGEETDSLRLDTRHLQVLEEAIEDFRELRAGACGRLTLERVTLGEGSDPLLAPSRVWTSVTPFRVTRHARRKTASEAVASSVREECVEVWRLPEPEVVVLGTRGIAGSGLEGDIRLDFRAAVAGPIILGRNRHLGGGLFSGDSGRKH